MVVGGDIVLGYGSHGRGCRDATPVDKMLHGSERLSLRSLDFCPNPGSLVACWAASQDGGETLAKAEAALAAFHSIELLNFWKRWDGPA